MCERAWRCCGGPCGSPFFFFRCLGTAGDFQEYKKSIQKEFNAPKKEKAKKEKKEKA